MKTINLISLIFLSILCFNTSAQEVTFSGKHGNAINIGLGSGGIIEYNSLGLSVTVFHISYKFNPAKRITLNPSNSFYRDRINYNWGNNKQDNTYINYYFQKTIIPTDVKSTYYFNQKLIANSKQDFDMMDSSDNATANLLCDESYLSIELSFPISGNSPIGFSIY